MKKRVISLLLALVLAATLLPVQVWGATVVGSGYCGGEGDGKNLTWTLDSDGVLTISGEGEMGNYWVYGNTPWYDQRNNIKKVVFSGNVTTIGKAAFYDCSALIEVSIPENVEKIQAQTFGKCSSLTSITLPDKISSVDPAAFDNCSSLQEIQVSANNKHYISDSGILFTRGKKGLCRFPAGIGGTYSIPKGVNSLYEKAFYGCVSLTDIIIPDSVTAIGAYAFADSCNLVNIDISDSVKTIGNSAFRNCSSLSELIIPDGVEKIGSGAFADCTK